MNEIQKNAQNALESIEIKTPGEEPKKESTQAPAIADHIFDPQFVEEAPPPPPTFVEKNPVILNSQAAIDDIKVKQIVKNKPVEEKSDMPAPIMPKTFDKKPSADQPQSEIDLAIGQAETDPEQQSEEQLDAKISGSGGIWES